VVVDGGKLVDDRRLLGHVLSDGRRGHHGDDEAGSGKPHLLEQDGFLRNSKFPDSGALEIHLFLR
jgi:hypothetical protein